MNKEQLRELIKECQELGVPQVTVEGITYVVPQLPIITAPVPEGLKPEDICKPMNPLDDMTEEELLYWSTDYYDELVAKKQDMAQKRDEEENK